MAPWSKQLEEAESLLAQSNANEAFRRAFGALESCYSDAANFPPGEQRQSFGQTARFLLEKRKVSRNEYDQAIHLAEARNVNVHAFGFEPSLGEAVRCVERIRHLCARFGISVADVMKKPVLVAQADGAIGTYLDLMREKGFTYLPVVDGQGRVIGTLDEWALIEAIRTQEGMIDLDRAATEYMSQDTLPTIPANASVEEAIKQLKKTRRSALLILADGKPTGIVTAFDLIR